MNVEQLVGQIRSIHDDLARQASNAVNLGLTLRNWLIGCHIQEYELRGEDRSEYGARLFDVLAGRLVTLKLPNCRRRQLYRYMDFYRTYPQIVGTLSPLFRRMVPTRLPKATVGTLSPQSKELTLTAEKLIETLSYSHFELLAAIDSPQKRTFYEIESVRGTWSVRELKRQIASLYYERSGLSRDKKKLAALVDAKVEHSTPALTIRDPYVFEFLGVHPQEVMPESRLERALLDRLEEFLLELGRGFCFEARQRRILIGGEHFFVDLVFYHRILKCHVIVELKNDGFTHEYRGQFNTYVSWYRKHEMSPGDNPPIGILLCTEKNHALVKYAPPGSAANSSSRSTNSGCRMKPRCARLSRRGSREKHPSERRRPAKPMWSRDDRRRSALHEEQRNPEKLVEARELGDLDKNLTNCARNRRAQPHSAQRSSPKTLTTPTRSVTVDVAICASEPALSGFESLPPSQNNPFYSKHLRHPAIAGRAFAGEPRYRARRGCLQVAAGQRVR